LLDFSSLGISINKIDINLLFLPFFLKVYGK